MLKTKTFAKFKQG